MDDVDGEGGQVAETEVGGGHVDGSEGTSVAEV